MAKKNEQNVTSLMADIQKDVNEISNNTKTFGTKLPTATDPNDAKKEKDHITYVDFVVGSLAQIIMGKPNAKLEDIRTILNADKTKSIFGTISNIRDILLDIQNNIIPETNKTNVIASNVNTNQTIKVYDEALYNLLNKSNNGGVPASNRIEMIISTGDGKHLNGEELKNLTEALNNFYDVIENYSDIDTSKIQDKLANVNKVIDAMKKNNGLQNIIYNLNKLKIDGNISTNLKNAFSIIGDLSSIINNLENIEIKKSDENIKKLSNLIINKKGKDGSIKTLINNLKELILKDELRNIDKSIDVLRSFIDAITSLVDISPFKIIKGKISLMLIDTILFSSIKHLIKKLNNIEEIVNSGDVKKSLEVFKSFIDAIIKLTEIDIKSYKKFRKNLNFIKNKIIDDIIYMIKDMSNKLNDVSVSGEDALNASFTVLDSLMKLKDYNKKDFNNIRKNLKRMRKTVNRYLKGFLQDVANIFNEYSNNEITNNIELTKDILNDFNDLFEDFLGIKKHLSNNIQLTLMISEIELIKYIIKSLSEFDENTFDKINDNVTVPLKILFEDFKEINEKVSNIDSGLFKSIDSIINTIERVESLSKMASISKLSTSGINIIANHVDSMINIINSFDEVDPENVKKANDTVNALMKIVIGSALILFIGATIMTFIEISNLISFSIALSILLYSIVSIFNSVGDGLKESLQGAKDAIILIATAGGILILGGLFMNFIDICSLALFGLTLVVFIGAIVGIFNFKWLKDGLNSLKESLQGAKDVAILVAVAGGILILGGLFMNVIDFWSLVGFTVILFVFIGAIVGIFKWLGDGLKESLQGAKDAALLVAVAGGILILGGLFMNVIDFWSLVGFTVILFVFIGAIVGIFKWLGDGLKESLKSATELTILVAVSAGVLILGSMLITNKMISPFAVIAFGVLLVGFIALLLLAYSFLGKKIDKAIPSMMSLSILVAISGGILLLAGYAISKNPGIAFGALVFGLTIAGFVWLMGRVLSFLGNAFAMIGIGLIVMIGIVILVGLSALVIKMVAETAKSEDFLKNVAAAGAAIFGMIITMAIAAGSIGALILNTGPLGISIGAALIAGAAVITGLLAIIGLAALVVNAVANSIRNINSIEPLQTKNIFSNIKAYIEIVDALMPLANPFKAIGLKMVLWSLSSLGKVLSTMAQGIKAWTTLRIPVYEGTKIVGYETITSDMFPIAAKNIKAVITTLSQAVVDAYDEKPELFEWDVFGRTKFGKVSKALKTLGPMLTSIAKGIKTWSKLNIPIYGKDGKIIDYEEITSNAFQSAALTIKNVIKTMAQAVIDTYDENPELFEWDVFGRTKFGKVSKALKTLGPMLTSIGKGIKTWASLQIPVYKNGSKEPSDYITLTKTEFDTAGKNISKVITTLVKAVINTYDKNPTLFEVEDEKTLMSIVGGGRTKFAKVAKSIGTIGPMLNSIGKAIKMWADLRIPVYKENSTEIKTYIQLDDDKFKTVGKNINEVVKCLAEGIVKAYENNDTLFEVEDTKTLMSIVGGGKTKFAKIAQSIGKIGPMLKGIGDAIQMWAELKIPVYKENSTEIKTYIQLDDGKFKAVGENIKHVVNCLIDSLSDAANKPAFKDGDHWFLGKSDSPFVRITKSIEPVGKLLKDMGEAIQMWADLKIPIYKNGETEPIDYKKLTDNDFENVGTNVGKVIDCLATSINTAYKSNDDFFNIPWYHFGMGDTPIEKVMKSMVPMGNMLKSIAEAIADWSELKIPIYGNKFDKDGNLIPTGYVDLTNKTKFKDVIENINTVVTTLITGVRGAYKGNEKYFDSDAWIGKGDSEIAKIVNSIEPMGKMLESIAEGVKFWAELKIPKYGNGGKIIGYVNLSDKTEMQNVGFNIALITTLLSSSILNTVKRYPELFDTDEKSSAVLKAIKAIKIGGDALASIAKTVGNYAEGKFQIMKLDKNGKWVGGEMIRLNKQKLTKLKEHIKTVICAIGEAIVTVYDESKDKGIFVETIDRGANGKLEPVKKNSPIAIVTSSIMFTATALNQMMNAIGKLINLDSSSVRSKLGDKSSGIIADINAIISKFLTLGSILGNDNHFHKYWDGYKEKKNISKIRELFKLWVENSKTSLTYISTIVNQYENILNNGSNIFDVYEKNKDSITNLINDDSIITSKLESIIELYTKIAKKIYSFNSNDILSELAFISTNSKNTILYSDSLKDIVIELFDNIQEISDNYNKIANINYDNIDKSISNITDTIKKFDGLFEINNDYLNKENTITDILNKRNSLTTRFNESLISLKMNMIIGISNDLIELGKLQSSISLKNYEDIYDGFSFLYNAMINSESVSLIHIERLGAIRNIIKQLINDVIDTPPLELFKILSEGLEYVYTITAKIQSISNFKSHTEWLQKYVKAVNGLNNVNLTSLIEFVNAVDKLSQGLGDLDKLTEAIGDKLSSVLCELVNELRKADTAIANAHKLQEKRKQLIQYSLDKVRGIMSQHMIVEISQTSTNNNEYTPDTSSTPNGETSSLSNGNLNNNQNLQDPSSTNINGNPENTPRINGSANTSINSNSNSNSNNGDSEVYRGHVQIDEEQFKRLCKNIFKQTVRKRYI